VNGGLSQKLSKRFVEEMHKEFEMSMLGELSFFLGLQISQPNKGIFISKTKYINEMLKKFKTEDCKPMSTPMIIGSRLRKYDESMEADQMLYKSMISIFLYVIESRPDVMQAIGVVAKFQSTPKKTHV